MNRQFLFAMAEVFLVAAFVMFAIPAIMNLNEAGWLFGLVILIALSVYYVRRVYGAIKRRMNSY